MPRVEIPLTGWQQTPDERGGQPRITRLINAMLDNEGRITKSPGSIVISTTGITAPVAFGPGFEIFNGTTGTTVAQGFRVAGSDGYHKGKSDYLSTCEAPRLRPVLTEASSQYERPGVIDIGGGDYLVVAERLPRFQADPTSDVFGSPYISWAFLSGDDDLRVAATGDLEFVTSGTPNARAFFCYAGTYVIGWKDTSNFRVRKWNATTRTFDFLADITDTGVGNIQIDAIYSESLDRLFVFSSSGKGFWINGTTGAVVWSDDLSLAGTLVAGSQTACFNNDAEIYLMWQGSATQWYTKSIVVSDAFGWSEVWAGGAIYTSPEAILSGTQQRMLRAEMVLNSTTNTIHAVVHCRTSATSTVLNETRLINFSDTVVAVVDDVARYRQCITKPYWDAVNGPVYWAFVSHPTMTLRHMELLGAGYLGTTGTAAKTAVCIGGDPGNSPDGYQVGACGPMVRSSYLPPDRAGAKRTGWIAALLVRRNSSAITHDVHVCMVADGRLNYTAVNNPADLTQIASARGESLIASGIPLGYSTQPEPSGFLGPPPPPQVTATNAGAIPAGTYYYVTAYKYVTATGAVMWSPVSDVASVTHAGTLYHDIVLFADTAIPATYKATVHLFRSVGGVYYEHYGIPGSMDYAQLATGYPMIDTTTDSQFIAGSPGILYTQGANGAVSGQLDHFGCPPCRCIWAGRSRMIAGGLAKENRVRWSNLFFQSEATSWPEFPSFCADIDEPVTAVAALDDTWVVFSANSIWLISGQGPDSMGSGSFEDPLQLLSGIGCRTWRSLVATPEGLMFQASDGQIYLLARGSYQVSVISLAIRDSLAMASPGYDPGPPSIWVRGAAYDAFAREVWFSTIDSDWILQRESMTWRQEYTYAVHGKALIGVYSMATPAYSGPVVIRSTVGAYRPYRRIESNHYRDATGAFRPLSIQTSDIDLVHGRISRVFVKTTLDYNNIGASDQAWITSYWYDGRPKNYPADGYQKLWPATYFNAFLELECDPARQKCNQVRILISEDPASYVLDNTNHVLGLAIEVTQTKQRPIRYVTGNGRMT